MRVAESTFCVLLEVNQVENTGAEFTNAVYTVYFAWNKITKLTLRKLNFRIFVKKSAKAIFLKLHTDK